MLEIAKEQEGIVRIFKGNEGATLRLKSTKGHSCYEGCGFLHPRDYRRSPNNINGRILKFDPLHIQDQANKEGLYPDFIDDVKDVGLQIFEADALTTFDNIVKTQKRKLAISMGLALREEKKELKTDLRAFFSHFIEVIHQQRNQLIEQLSLLKQIILSEGVKMESLLVILEKSQTEDELLRELEVLGISSIKAQGIIILWEFMQQNLDGLLLSFWRDMMDKIDQIDVSEISKKLNELINEMEHKIASAQLRFHIDKVLVGSVDFSWKLHIINPTSIVHVSRGTHKNNLDLWEISYTAN